MIPRPDPAAKRLALDGCLIHQHDGNVVLYRIDPVTLHALQTLGILPVFERLFACRTYQNFKQLFGDHIEAFYDNPRTNRHRVTEKNTN